MNFTNDVIDSNSNFSDKLLRRKLAKERRKAKKKGECHGDGDGDNDMTTNDGDNLHDNNNTLKPIIYSCHNLHVHGIKQRYNPDDDSNSYNDREIVYSLLHEEALELYNEGNINLITIMIVFYLIII